MTTPPPTVAETKERQGEMDARFDALIRRLEAATERLEAALGLVRGEDA